MGATQPWNSLAELRQALIADVPHLKKIDQVPENEWQMPEAGEMGAGDFPPAIEKHYLTNPILRASEVMGELTALAASRSAAKLAAE